MKYKYCRKTRGHNIVADGWAGAANLQPHPRPHPTPFPTQTHTRRASKTLVFPLFDSIITDRRTDEPMDQRTDKASYRVACPQLKRQGKKERREQVTQGYDILADRG